MSKQLLLGDEAIAQAALDAGLSGVYAYPGTPSTEITEYIQMAPITAEKNIHNRWCSNEKTAMEAALGMSFAGKRSLVCMKHVGMNVAADCFINSAITGVKGGLIIIAADDPSMHSSQNEQDSRFYGDFSLIPMYEPSNQYLEEDEADPNSKNDFGMNIIPALLRDGRKMYAYRFAGYWRDVGTIDSLWEANMEVLDPENSGIDIFDEKWKIYSRNPVLPPQKIGPRAVVQDSLVTEGCKIYGNVHHSVLSAGVVVEEGATVEDAVLMDGVVVKAGAVVKRCILAEDVVVGAGARVGGDGPIAHVGTGLTVGAGATVKEGAKVFESVKEGMEVC